LIQLKSFCVLVSIAGYLLFGHCKTRFVH